MPARDGLPLPASDSKLYDVFIALAHGADHLRCRPAAHYWNAFKINRLDSCENMPNEPFQIRKVLFVLSS